MKTEFLTNELFADYYENGQIKAEGHYKGSNRDGKWILWYKNGQKKSEIYYKDGKYDGKWTLWHANGYKKWEGNYKDGVLIPYF